MSLPNQFAEGRHRQPIPRVGAGLALLGAGRALPLTLFAAYAILANGETPFPILHGARDVTDRIGAILVAAGESSRMGGLDKVFAPLLGKPLVAHSLDALAAVPGLTDAVLVLSAGALDRGRRLLADGPWPASWRACEGGPRRQDSVRRGLEAMGEVDWVVVHDAARPCAEAGLVAAVLDAARETGAAVAAVRVTDTIKVVDAGGTVVETLDRERLWAVQTPQAFRRDLLARAHAGGGADATDDAALVERLGHPVRVAPGAASNLKVTTPTDLVLVEAILRAERALHPGAGGATSAPP